MKVVFFRIPKPKQFKYPPRYYDAEKEHWEQRRKELGMIRNGENSDFKSQMGSSWNRLRKKDINRQKIANRSVLVYLLIAAILIYFIFFA